METIQINKSNALKAYNGSTGEVKKALGDLLGSEVVNAKIEDRIQGWESVAEMMGFHPVNDLPYPSPVTERQEAVNSFFVLDVTADAYNEGKIPDFSNENQQKWREWFKFNKTGFAFSDSFTDYDDTYTSSGARLSLLNQAHVVDRAKKFDSYFQKLLTKKQQQNESIKH